MIERDKLGRFIEGHKNNYDYPKGYNKNSWFKKGHKGIKNKGMLGKHHSEKTIEKFKDRTAWSKGKSMIHSGSFKSGENHPNWKGGIKYEPYDKRFNNKFKRAIRKRDNYICLKCNIHQEKLSKSLAIHHINYDKKLTILQNCCSLCNKCNAEVNFNRKHWTKFFQSLLSEKYDYQYSKNKEIIMELQ